MRTPRISQVLLLLLPFASAAARWPLAWGLMPRPSHRHMNTIICRHMRQPWVPRKKAVAAASTRRQQASRTDDDGDMQRGVRPALEVDEETLARAREAAKSDDYDWFMEFIAGDDSSRDRSAETEGRGREGVRDLGRNVKQTNDVSSRGYRDDYQPVRLRRRIDDSDHDYHDDMNASYNFRRGGDSAERFATRPREGSPYPRDRFGSVNKKDDRWGSQMPEESVMDISENRDRRYRTPADTMYDYDFDDEYEGEVGGGGWAYDPEFTADVAARRRDVDVDRVRSRARIAASRLPLGADDEEELERGQDGNDGLRSDLSDMQARGEEDEAGAARSAGSAIDADKAGTLVKQLGYTSEEVSCMDPDMADLAIERGLQRPASGMPVDWAITGSNLAAATSAAPEGLDLDEILRDERGLETVGRKSARGRKSRSGRQVVRRKEYDYIDYEEEDGEFYAGDADYTEAGDVYRSSIGGSDRYATEQDAFGGDVDDSQGRPYGGGSARGRPSEAGRGWKRRPPPARRSKRKLDPAQKYEMRMRKGSGGNADEDEENLKIWTGVGEEGPWPTLEEFTDMLREETQLRLSVVGPWAADIVALENKFRLQAYEQWLKVLEKGIGETLEEAGLFDAEKLRSDDDYAFDDREDSEGIDGSKYSGAKRTRYYGNDSGRPSVRKSDYDYRDGFEGEDYPDVERSGVRGEERRRRPRRGHRDWDKNDDRPTFDIGNFLRSGANMIVRAADGFDEEAKRFDREYPGAATSSKTDEDPRGRYEDDPDVRDSARRRY